MIVTSVQIKTVKTKKHLLSCLHMQRVLIGSEDPVMGTLFFCKVHTARRSGA